MSGKDTSLGGAKKRFPETVWGLISRASDTSTGVRREGLAELVQSYWKPVYALIRIAWAKSNEDAKDLTQAFFLWLLEGDALERYQPDRASFRQYLKTLVRHFVQHEEEARHRLKRGGAVRVLGLDHIDPALAPRAASSEAGDPDQLFDRTWKRTLIEQAMDRVRDRLRSAEAQLRFRVFEAYDLCTESERPSYAQVAERLGLKEADVRNYLFRVREEIRSDIRRELSRLTQSPEDLEEEWHALFGG